MRYVSLPAAWLIGVVAVAWAARWPEPNLGGIVTEHRYPAADVSWILLSMTAEVAIVLVVLQLGSYAQSWIRALTASLVSLCFLWATYSGVHGTPPTYISLFGLWILAVSGGLGALFIWSALASLPAPDEPANTP